jgi:hypothetical protein
MSANSVKNVADDGRRGIVQASLTELFIANPQVWADNPVLDLPILYMRAGSL